MELTAIIIAVLSLLGSLYATYANNKANKLKNSAETFDIQIDSAKKIMEELRTELERQKETILELKHEINILKTQEKIHIIEKIRLEERIEVLMKENTSLQEQIDNNRNIYNQQIMGLDDQIAKLKGQLNRYKNNK